MNANVLQFSSFPVAFAALALVPISPFAACLAITAAGFLSVLLLDYGTARMPVAIPAPIVPFGAANPAPDATREAA